MIIDDKKTTQFNLLGKNANIRNTTAAKNTYLTARKNEENSIEENR